VIPGFCSNNQCERLKSIIVSHNLVSNLENDLDYRVNEVILIFLIY
jgi:hypothetical protein